MTIKVAIIGAQGRMGREIMEAILYGTHDIDISFLVVSERSKDTGMCLSNIYTTYSHENGGDLEYTTEVEYAIKNSDVVVDFTNPTASCWNAKVASDNNKPIIIGTTGFSHEQMWYIRRYSEKTSLMLSSNMSYGANEAVLLVGELSKSLVINQGSDWNVDIIETHHSEKLDTPSGTAKMIADEIKRCSWDKMNPRIHSIRSADNVGEHKVIFSTKGESITITHKATTREVFAQGVIHAINWITDKPNGLYSTKDIFK